LHGLVGLPTDGGLIGVFDLDAGYFIAAGGFATFFLAFGAGCLLGVAFLAGSLSE